MSKPAKKRPLAFWKIFLLFIMAGTTVLVFPALAADKPVVTVVAQGSGSYYLGEKVPISGINTETGSTYLYITGPNLPENGGKLTSPDQKPVSGDTGSFTVVNTSADKTWEYAWVTSGLMLDAGSYTIYATGKPKTRDQNFLEKKFLKNLPIKYQNFFHLDKIFLSPNFVIFPSKIVVALKTRPPAKKIIISICIIQ